jgi:fucose permease
MATDGTDRRRETWTAYAYLSVFDIFVYAVGALTPYLRDALHLSDAQAALHPSAMAVGLVSAGTIADAVERRLGGRGAVALAVGLMLLAALALASAAALPVTLAGAYALGVGGGAVLSAVNLMLGRPGGTRAAVRFARANTWSMLASFLAPVSIAALAASPLGWRAVPLVPLALLIALELAGGLTPGGSTERSDDVVAVRLPRAFWLTWAFVIVVVAIEFSYVVWGSTIVAVRTGVTRETGTGLVALFMAGMLAGRLALGMGVVGTARTPRWIGFALLVTGTGGVIVWASASPLASGTGLLLAGLGTATLYPLGMAQALGRAAGAALAAGARMTLASGLAILVAPLVLGALSDVFGVVSEWPLVIGLSLVAGLLSRAASGSAAGVPAPAGAPVR